MSDPISSLPDWQRERLDLIVTALGDPPMSFTEQASFAILAGMGDLTDDTVNNIAAVLERVSQAKRFTG
jgi:hypothetical protein